MHEIITLQLGQPSNYLATHFWNAQEAYFTYSDHDASPVDHNIHWRPGLAADGSETFMPRTVIYDLKGGFGALRKINALYDTVDDSSDPASNPLWSSSAVVQRQPPIEPAAYQISLEAGDPAAGRHLNPAAVRYWSDFNRVYLHPRSAVQLAEYELDSSLRPFERWATGEELFGELDREHDLLDRDLRPFVEEADQMQAVQVFTTIDDAWGAFAARYAERLRDEYGKTMLWVWALQDSGAGLSRDKRLMRMANKAHALTELYKQASILVPFSLPTSLSSRRNLSLDATSRWHTSALLTTALESASLPSRLRSGPGSDRLDGMAEWLNVMGRQTITNLQMDVVDEPADGAAADPRQRSVLAALDDEDGAGDVELSIDFTAGDDHGSAGWQLARKKRHVFGQTISARGMKPSQDAPAQDARFARQHQPSGKASVRSYYTDLRFPQPDSFPRIYTTGSGEAVQGSALSMVASLTTDSSTSDRLKLLRTTVSRSIGIEDRENLGSELAQMADEYHEGWSSGSDDGDDD